MIDNRKNANDFYCIKKPIKKYSLMAYFITFLLPGCGSLTTVVKDETFVISELNKKRTNCSTLPRIYSGVAYDFCLLNSDNAGSYDNHLLLGFYVTDILFSAVFDTVLIPYSGYKQIKEGNICLNEEFN